MRGRNGAPKLPHLAAPRVVGADEIELGGLALFALVRHEQGDLFESALSFEGNGVDVRQDLLDVLLKLSVHEPLS